MLVFLTLSCSVNTYKWYVSENTCLHEVDMQNIRLVVVTLSVDVEKTQRIAA
jgi:hypothetical protein